MPTPPYDSTACRLLTLALLVLGSRALPAQQVSAPEELSLTIGTDQESLVREVRQVNLVAGENRVRLTSISPRILPESLHLRCLNSPRGVRLLDQALWFEVLDSRRVLDALVGREVHLRYLQGETIEEIEGRLLLPPAAPGPDGIVRVPLFVEVEDGTIRMLPEAEVQLDSLPAGDFHQLRLDWTLVAQAADRYRLELLYRTRGLWFEPSAVLRLEQDGSRADLRIVAHIHNQTGIGFPRATVAFADSRAARGAAASMFPASRELSLPAECNLDVLLAQAVDVEVTTCFALPPAQDPLGLPGPTVPVRRRIELSNAAAAGLGRPLLECPVEVLRLDANRHPFPASRGRLPATPAEAPIFLFAEPLAEVAAHRHVHPSPTARDRQVTLQLVSERSEPVVVEIMEQLGVGETLRPAPEGMRRLPGWALFPVTLSRGAALEVTYRVELE